MATNKKPKTLLIIIPSLTNGGAERIVSLLLQNFNRSLLAPKLVVFTNDITYSVPADVQIINLNKKRSLDFIKLIWKLAKVYNREKPDVVLSFLNYTNFLSILASKISRTSPKLIISERNSVSSDIKHQRFSLLKKILIKALYPSSDGVISLSQAVAEDLINNFKIKKDFISVIYNGIDTKNINILAKKPLAASFDVPIKNRFVISSIGRLEDQKGFQYLIQAFKLVSKKVSSVLIILGEGKERHKLEQLAKDLNVDKDVYFLGFQENPYAYLSRCDLFVSSSIYEGFGNVIVEAMTCKLPVIATDCPYSAPKEIITHGVNGLLVQPRDYEAIASAILSLVDDSRLRDILSKEGLKRAGEFGHIKMVKQYERIMLER